MRIAKTLVYTDFLNCIPTTKRPNFYMLEHIRIASLFQYVYIFCDQTTVLKDKSVVDFSYQSNFMLD